MKRRYLKNTLGVLALSNIALFGCNGQNTSNDKPTQEIITKVIIDENKLEDTFLKVVGSIKSGEVDDFKLKQEKKLSLTLYGLRRYLIEIPKTTAEYKYDVIFSITDKVDLAFSSIDYPYSRGFYICVSVNGNSNWILSRSKEVGYAFDYLEEVLGGEDKVKYEEKSLEEILFGKEQELKEEK